MDGNGTPFWKVPTEIELAGYRLKFNMPEAAAVAEARDADNIKSKREKFRAVWSLLTEHLAGISRGEEPLPEEEAKELFASPVFAVWTDELVMAVFFRFSVRAVAEDRFGPGRPGARQDEPEGHSGREGRQQVPGLPDDVSGKGLARLDGESTEGGTAQQGMVPGLHEKGRRNGRVPRTSSAKGRTRRRDAVSTD